MSNQSQPKPDTVRADSFGTKKTPKITFIEALEAINCYKKVTCVVYEGHPVVYEVKHEELTINGEIKDYRDFAFSPSQILFGTWTIEEVSHDPT